MVRPHCSLMMISTLVTYPVFPEVLGALVLARTGLEPEPPALEVLAPWAALSAAGEVPPCAAFAG